jgi:hypothetical protein
MITGALSTNPFTEAADPHTAQNFSEAWAKKYLQRLSDQDALTLQKEDQPATVAVKLMQSLRSTSAHAWIRTEGLLSQEIVRHEVNANLIDPWEVARDAYSVYEKTLSAYAEGVSPARLSIAIAGQLGQIRRKYTAVDPRVIGFISMQFHYTGQMLMEPLSPSHQKALGDYFKVIDDHLYMPLQRAYAAAAQHSYDSPQLLAVRRLLPLCTDIAHRIVDRVVKLYPAYNCHTGKLSEPAIRISSVRDVEMFQVYLWVCVLENNVSAVQQELFPLCVMLYPRLKVRWELVRQMIHMMGTEARSLLDPEQVAYYQPYHQVLWSMFSPSVFPESY